MDTASKTHSCVILRAGGGLSPPQSTFKGRGEIGGEYLPSKLERTPQLCSWWYVDTVKGGGRAHPTHTGAAT